MTGLTKIDRGLTAFEKKIKKSVDKYSSFFTKPFAMIGNHLKIFAKHHHWMFKGIETNSKESSKKTQRNIKGIGNSLAWAVAKGQLLANAITSFGRAAKRTIMEQIPEIGQAFGIAKGIIFKNLFWPLRQAVIPLLQKMLDWVRDNRGQFVKMGEVILNLFRVAVTVAKTFMNALSPMWGALKSLMGFGKGDWMDNLNLALAKISVLAIYIGNIIKPIAGWIGGLVKDMVDSGLLKAVANLAIAFGKVAWNALKGVIDGFMNGAGPGLTSFFNDLTELLNLIGGPKGDGVYGAFKQFGEFIGGAFVVALRAAGVIITAIAGAISHSVNSLRVADAFLGGRGEEASAIGREMLRSTRDTSAMTAFMAGDTRALDAIKQRSKLLGGLGAKSEDQAQEIIVKQLGETWSTYVDILKRGRDPGMANEAAKDMNELLGKYRLFDTMGMDPRGFDKNKANEFLKKAGGTQKINDGVVQNGKAVSTDPRDVIVAHKGKVEVNKGRSMAAMGPVNINLTVTEGNSRSAGINFAEGLQYQLRAQLATESMIGG